MRLQPCRPRPRRPHPHRAMTLLQSLLRGVRILSYSRDIAARLLRLPGCMFARTYTMSKVKFRISIHNHTSTHLFGLGSCKRLCILVRIAATSYVGLHRFCKMSRHSSPLLYTFGWNMRERNLTVGGLFGYDSSNVSRSLNVPSSNGVSAGSFVRAGQGKRGEINYIPGPKMTAFHNMRLSLHGAPDIPCGGSDESFLKSRIRRRRQGVDIGCDDCGW